MLLGFLVLLLLALIPASIAKNKGRSFGLWYFYGVCLWIVALLHSLVIDPLEDEANRGETVNTYWNDMGDQQTSFDIPILVKGYEVIEKDGKFFLKIAVQNLSGKILKAFKCKVTGMDSFGEVILVDGKEDFTIKIQDISAPSYQNYSTTSRMPLPNDEIRTVKLFINEALFDDGSIVRAERVYFYDKLIQLPSEIQDTLRIKYPYARYLPLDNGNYWTCSCGYRNNTDTCKNCKSSKEDVLNSCREENFISESRGRGNKAESNVEEDRAKKKKLIAILIASISTALALVIGICFYYNSTLEGTLNGKWTVEIDGLYQYPDSYVVFKFDSGRLSQYDYVNRQLQDIHSYWYEVDSENTVSYSMLGGAYTEDMIQVTSYDHDTIHFIWLDTGAEGIATRRDG